MLFEGSRVAPAIGLASATVLGASLVLHSRLSHPAEAQEAPPPSAVVQSSEKVEDLSRPLGCQRERYQDLLRRDAEAFTVAVPSAAEQAAPLGGGVEFSGARALEQAPTSINERPAPRGKRGPRRPVVIRGALETQSLSIRLEVERLPLGQELKEHLVLSVTNRTAAPVAYRVQTEVPSGAACARKYSLPHNEIVLYPGEVARRTECLAGPGKPTLRVRRVEAYPVTDLGARYLRRLPAVASPAFDPRVSSGHRGEPLPLCAHDFGNALARLGGDGFRVMVDFYSRHNCEFYRLPVSYRPGGAPPSCDGARDQGERATPPLTAMTRTPIELPPPPVLGGAAIAVLLLTMLLRSNQRRQLVTSAQVAAILVQSMEGANLSDAYFR